jgi:hypothetical protein
MDSEGSEAVALALSRQSFAEKTKLPSLHLIDAIGPVGRFAVKEDVKPAVVGTAIGTDMQSC